MRTHLLRPIFACAALALCASAVPAVAHHSYAMFDRNKTTTVQGTIAKIDWSDPHVFFWIYVSNGKGGYDLYALEAGSVNNLVRRGWTKTTLQVGEKVSADFHPLKDGRNGGSFVQVGHADGTKLQLGVD